MDACKILSLLEIEALIVRADGLSNLPGVGMVLNIASTNKPVFSPNLNCSKVG